MNTITFHQHTYQKYIPLPLEEKCLQENETTPIKLHWLTDQESLQTRFIITFKAIAQQTHFHSDQCPLEWLLSAITSETEGHYFNLIPEEFNQTQLIPLNKIFVFLWQGMQCEECSGIYISYLTKKYGDLLRVILWYNQKSLASIKQYVRFYSVMDFALKQTSNGSEMASKLWSWALDEASEGVFQEICKQNHNPKQGSQLTLKRNLQSSLQEQLYFYELTFALLQIKYRGKSCPQLVQNFIKRYIQTANPTEIQLITQIWYLTHQKNQCKEYQSRIADSLRKKMERELDWSGKKKKKIVQMLEGSPEPKDCPCLVHHFIQKHMRIHRSPVNLNLPRTESKILLNSDISQSVNAFVESQILQSFAPKEGLGESPQRFKAKGKKIVISTESVLQESAPIPTQSTKVRNLIQSELILTSSSEDASKVLSELECSCSTDPKQVARLFQSYILLLGSKNQFITKITESYQLGDQACKKEWKKVINVHRLQLGRLYQALDFK